MKAIYKKSIIDQLKELIDTAVNSNEELDYILVTAEEAVKIYNKLNTIITLHPWVSFIYLSDKDKIDEINNSYYLGIRLKVEGLA